ncbi:hypothetical protein CP980_33020 [Streptomyces vinaceus]|uniref:Uncharacterized protein n=1 Tax=Streptomyces vinaceus TaxID=1960 RepID=A0A5J6JN66_STRVI|nr:hypothetical protein [Streptomyces vinaceus]QEV49256.1 hypothetical protein CP980_33020 [Streptomyces vinaceus]GHE64055.1 hypothetical protein GCM10017778_55900 [Streptomyces vinaceus]
MSLLYVRPAEAHVKPIAGHRPADPPAPPPGAASGAAPPQKRIALSRGAAETTCARPGSALKPATVTGGAPTADRREAVLRLLLDERAGAARPACGYLGA